MKNIPIILLIIVVILLILTYGQKSEYHNFRDRALPYEDVTEIYDEGPDMPVIIHDMNDIDTGIISYADGAGGIDSLALIIGGKRAVLIIDDTIFFDGESYIIEK